MTAPGAPTNEFLALMCDLAEHRLSPEDIARLRQRLSADPAARQQYVDFMLMLSNLHWIWGTRADEHRSTIGHQSETDGESTAPSGGRDSAADVRSPVSITPPVFAAFHPFASVPAIAGGVLLSYTMAFLMIAAAIVAAATWHARGNVQLARAVHKLPERATVAPTPLVVGKITGLSDCRWADLKTAPGMGEAVALGRSFALTSGRLEITYSTGERILLQGPAAYEARWPNGGLLTRGTLTAHAMTTSANPPQSGPLAEQYAKYLRESAASPRPAQPPGPDPANIDTHPAFLFFVRTPSTLAISRRAVFEMSVDESGATRTRLSLGLIEAWYPRGGKPNDTIVSSAALSWTWVGFTDKHDVRVLYGTGRAPDSLAMVMRGARGRPELSAGNGKPLRIWGLESQPQGAAVDNSRPEKRQDHIE